LHPIEDSPNRTLHFDDYVSYVLLHLLNPGLDSIRLLQLKGEERLFRERFGLPRLSLGAFSEAGSVFPAEELAPIVEQLSARLRPMPSHPELLALPKQVIAFDGSLLAGSITMDWASWHKDARAAKMHCQYDLSKGAPRSARLTDANSDERQVLKESIQKNCIYIIDRGLRDYELFGKIISESSSFVFRSPSNIVYEVINTLPLSPQAQAQGVKKDQIVRVGCKASPELQDHNLRLVEIFVPKSPCPRKQRKHVWAKCKNLRIEHGDYTILLLTDLLDLDVLLLALLYRCRWEIELFFRWFKGTLKADHLLSQSKNGLLILIYCALIVTLLLALWADARPTKYLLSLFTANLMGTLTDLELDAKLLTLADHAKIG